MRNLAGDVILYRQQIGRLAIVLLAPQLFAITNVVEFDVHPNAVALRGDAAGEYRLDFQLVTNLLCIHLLALVMQSDTMRNHSQVGQTRQAVIDAFGDSIRNVVRVGIVTPIFQRENGDGIDCARPRPLPINAHCDACDQQQSGGDRPGNRAPFTARNGRVPNGCAFERLAKIGCRLKAPITEISPGTCSRWPAPQAAP